MSNNRGRNNNWNFHPEKNLEDVKFPAVPGETNASSAILHDESFEGTVGVEIDDVLLGRGKSNINHPGNIRFQGRSCALFGCTIYLFRVPFSVLVVPSKDPMHSFRSLHYWLQRSLLIMFSFLIFSTALVEAYRDQYVLAKTHHSKQQVTKLVRRELMGRFLRFNKELSSWEEISSDATNIKISQAIQYRQRQLVQRGMKSPNPFGNVSAVKQQKVKRELGETAVRGNTCATLAMKDTPNFQRDDLYLTDASLAVLEPRPLQDHDARIHLQYQKSDVSEDTVFTNDDVRWALGVDLPSDPLLDDGDTNIGVAFGERRQHSQPAEFDQISSFDNTQQFYQIPESSSLTRTPTLQPHVPHHSMSAPSILTHEYPQVRLTPYNNNLNYNWTSGGTSFGTLRQELTSERISNVSEQSELQSESVDQSRRLAEYYLRKSEEK